ncbi:MAG TPA: hypothetical protein ENH94_00520, partial [Phycisphaerales bacterium]|nr:hypothetical protein [Phycisphaerales bacterium]
SHKYLFDQFCENGFFISPEERYIIQSFLKDRSVGIPQGTSISLFLANLTCWSVDQKLEKEGIKFSRYADEIIAWSPEYSKICNSFLLINEFSKEAGVRINIAKSEGINLLSKPSLRIPVMANSDSGGSRTAVRMMANKSRSEATLFF